MLDVLSPSVNMQLLNNLQTVSGIKLELPDLCDTCRYKKRPVHHNLLLTPKLHRAVSRPSPTHSPLTPIRNSLNPYVKLAGHVTCMTEENHVIARIILKQILENGTAIQSRNGYPYVVHGFPHPLQDCKLPLNGLYTASTITSVCS